MKLKLAILGLGVAVFLIMNIISLQLENEALNKENGELKQDIIDYKWQLEQVPMIMESVKDEWCKDYK